MFCVNVNTMQKCHKCAKTPLILASCKGYVHIVELLLGEKNIEVNKADTQNVSITLLFSRHCSQTFMAQKSTNLQQSLGLNWLIHCCLVKSWYVSWFTSVKKTRLAWGACTTTCSPPWLCVLIFLLPILLHPLECELGLMSTLWHKFTSFIQQFASFWQLFETFSAKGYMHLFGCT